ncbi:sugar ABC transporter substrate-binding protein [Fontimonas sp. SYSU GA230001]|uniref:ABC transporter substrate-binding protein n=1 Tax=Fontimonas sp. SYSU GA230001 TaxID=3142450 RepID=UPI0032B5A583
MTIRPLLVPCLIATLVAACGRDDRAAATTAAAADTPVTFQVFGDPAEIAAYKALVTAFEAENPGRRVTLIPVGKQSDHMTKLSAAYASGKGPDVFVLNFRRFGQFAERGALEAVGPALAARGWSEQDYYEPAIEAFRQDGTLMCVPQNVSSLVVYYNRALFRRFDVPYPSPHWTYFEFSNAARKLTRDTDGDGRIDIYGVALEPTLIRLAPFIWSAGGDIVNDVRRPTMLTLDRPDALRALGVVRSLSGPQGVTPPLAAHQAEDEDARFARGGVAMLFQSRRFTTTLRARKDLDWDVAPFPTLRKPVSALHADGYCLSRNTAHRDAALDFIRYAVGAEGQALMTRTGRLVPSLKSVAESPVFLDPEQPPASARVFLDAIPLLRRTPNIAAWHEIESRADTILEEWFFEPPVGAGAVDPDAGGGEGMALAIRLRDAVQPLLLRDLQQGKP